MRSETKVVRPLAEKDRRCSNENMEVGGPERSKLRWNDVIRKDMR